MNPPKETIIMGCIDIMAGFEHTPEPQRPEILQTVIDTLSVYPKPSKKGDTVEPPAQFVGAYLCASNVRNACKLALFKVWDIPTAVRTINTNLETALTLLIE